MPDADIAMKGELIEEMPLGKFNICARVN